MLTDGIAALIRDEQARSGGAFIDTPDFDAYLAKLDASAEILADTSGDRCRGFVAFYCNDEVTKQAFISLVLVDPRDRGLGVGQALVGGVVDFVRCRGFVSCRLEVHKGNAAAKALYESAGFRDVQGTATKDVMEILL